MIQDKYILPQTYKPTEHIRVTVEQRCLAAQALWVAVNRMLAAGDIRAREWYQCIGYDEMRYRCRCKRTIETYYDAREMAPKELWPVPEVFASMFLHVCMTRKSMNCNRDWRVYLGKEIDATISEQPSRRPI